MGDVLKKDKTVNFGAFLSSCLASLIAIVLEFGFFADSGWFSQSNHNDVITWLQQNSRTLEPLVGTIIPILILAFLEKRKSTESVRYIDIDHQAENSMNMPSRPAYLFSAKIIGTAILILGILFLGLSLTQAQDQTILLTATVILFALGVVIFALIKKEEKARLLIGVSHKKSSREIRQEEFKVLE